MNRAETTVSTRVQELTAHFADTERPVEVDVAGVTIRVPIRPEASAACYERGVIPLTAGEFAWLTVARESLNGQLDIPTILQARAVLPAHAQLGGIVLSGEHSGDPYFHHAEHPTLVICAHATPPVGKRPLLVVTPEEISELFAAGTGAVALLVEVKSALPDAHTFRVHREGICRGEFDFLWQSRSIHLCDHAEERAIVPPSAPGQLMLPRNVLPMFAALNDSEKDTMLQVFTTFPGATLVAPPA
jgi:hypothetical protein